MGRKLKILISRSDLIKLMLACTNVQWDFLDEMHQAEKDGNKVLTASKESTAAMWERIHNELEVQLNDFDKKYDADKWLDI